MKSNIRRKKCEKHNQNYIAFVCFDEKCREKERLVCAKCNIDHQQHQLLDDGQIDKKVKESQQTYKQTITYLNKKFDELTEQFSKLRQSFVDRFDISIEKLERADNNQEYQQYINQIIKLDKSQWRLTKTFIDGYIFFVNQINECQKDLDLDLSKLEYIVNTEKFYFDEGFKYYEQEQYEHAIYQIDKALNYKSNDKHKLSLYYKAESLKMLDQYQEAIEFYDKVLEIAPKHKLSFFGKGDSLRMLGQYQQSIEQYNQVIQIDRKHKYALFGKGDSLRMLDQYQESIQWFDKALESDRRFNLALKGKGDSLRMLQQYDDAIKCFDEALKNDQNFDSALGLKGACLMEIREFDKAEISLKKAIELNPNEQQYKDQLKKLYKRRQP